MRLSYINLYLLLVEYKGFKKILTPSFSKILLLNLKCELYIT